MLTRSIESEHEGPGAVTVWYYVKGDKGAVQFMLMTIDGRQTPADLGYHAYKPQREGQTSSGPCEALGGQDCYYAGSSSMARRVLDRFTESGNDPEAIWTYLENYYEGVFGCAR